MRAVSAAVWSGAGSIFSVGCFHLTSHSDATVTSPGAVVV